MQMQKSKLLEIKCKDSKAGVANSFSLGGHISLMVTFKGLNVILGLYKCNYSLTVKQDLSTATR